MTYLKNILIYFKLCVILTSYIANFEVENFLFKFKEVNNCVIASIAIEKRFDCKKIITLKIRYQNNKIFKIKCKRK